MKLHRCLGPNPGMRTYDCRRRMGGKIKKWTKLGGSSITARQRKKHSLFIEGAAAAGGGAIFKEGICKLPVEMVRHRPVDSFPRQDKDDQHGRVTVVPRPLADQTQQLLLFAATPDHLSDDCAHTHTYSHRALTHRYHKIMDPTGVMVKAL